MLASVPYLQICTLLARCSGATIMSLLPNVISLTRNEPNVWFRRHRLSGRGIQGTISCTTRLLVSDLWQFSRCPVLRSSETSWEQLRSWAERWAFGSFANLLPIFCWVHGVISCAFHVLSISVYRIYCSSTFHCSDGNIWARGSFFSLGTDTAPEGRFLVCVDLKTWRHRVFRSSKDLMKSGGYPEALWYPVIVSIHLSKEQFRLHVSNSFVRPSITICWGDIERQIDPICQTSSLTPWTLSLIPQVFWNMKRNLSSIVVLHLWISL